METSWLAAMLAGSTGLYQFPKRHSKGRESSTLIALFTFQHLRISSEQGSSSRSSVCSFTACRVSEEWQQDAPGQLRRLLRGSWEAAMSASTWLLRFWLSRLWHCCGTERIPSPPLWVLAAINAISCIRSTSVSRSFKNKLSPSFPPFHPPGGKEKFFVFLKRFMQCHWSSNVKSNSAQLLGFSEETLQGILKADRKWSESGPGAGAPPRQQPSLFQSAQSGPTPPLSEPRQAAAGWVFGGSYQLCSLLPESQRL